MNKSLLSLVAVLAIAAPAAYAADAHTSRTTTQTTRTTYAQTGGRTFLGYQGPYIALDAGLSAPRDFNGDTNVTGVGSFSSDADIDNSLLLSGAFGVRLAPQVRGEVEVSYRNTESGDFTVAGVLVPGSENDVKAWNYMANAYYDFDFGQAVPVVPYIMGGIGAATIDADGYDSDTVFAYQLGVGFSVPVTNQVSLTAGYRWLDTAEFELDTAGGSISDEFQEHQFRAGVRYEF